MALDGSDCALSAADYALELARNNNASVTFVHVVDTTSILVSLPPETGKQADTIGRDDTREMFAKVRGMARRKRLDIKTEVIESPASAADAIVSYAKKKNFDLVVVGTKGRSGISKALLGSVASRVAERSPCPVLVVR